MCLLIIKVLCNKTFLQKHFTESRHDCNRSIRVRVNPLAFVNESGVKDTPKKKPTMIPTKVVTVSLIVSFVLLIFKLQPKERNATTLYQSNRNQKTGPIKFRKMKIES